MLTPEQRKNLAERALDGDLKAESMLEEDAYQRHKAEADAKRAKKARSESELQKQIARACEAQGWLVIRVNSMVTQPDDKRFLRAYYVQNINTSSGHADLVCYRNGRAVFLEVKTPTGRQSESQKRFQSCAVKYGMNYYIVRSIEEALACLNNQ